MIDYGFDDLLSIRKGGDALTLGAGDSWIGEVETPQEWQIKADALRELFIQTLGVQPELSTETCLKVLRETDRKTHWLREIEYSVGDDERIQAYVLIPKGLKAPAPGMLCVPPTKHNPKEWLIGDVKTPEGFQRAYALHLVERGYVTLVYEWICSGSRAYEGCPMFDTQPFYEKYPNWSIRGKDLFDAARGLDVLQQMDEVDSPRVGSIGHSQGGGISVDFAAVDARVKVCVSSCGACPERLSKNPFNNARTSGWVGRPALRSFCLTGKHFPIDLHEVIALAAPRAVFLSNAVNDYLYHLDKDSAILRDGLEQMNCSVDKVYRLLDAEDQFKSLLHAEGHGFPEDQRDAAYKFIDQVLKRSEK